MEQETRKLLWDPNEGKVLCFVPVESMCESSLLKNEESAGHMGPSHPQWVWGLPRLQAIQGWGTSSLTALPTELNQKRAEAASLEFTCRPGCLCLWQGTRGKHSPRTKDNPTTSHHQALLLYWDGRPLPLELERGAPPTDRVLISISWETCGHSQALSGAAGPY